MRGAYFPHMVLVGIILGVVYFKLMDDSIPDSLRRNCSYSSGLVTDILAFAVGAVLLWRGFALNDYLVFACGIAITTEHVIQMLAKRER